MFATVNGSNMTLTEVVPGFGVLSCNLRKQ
jgi:hypothetical protein